MATHPRIVDAIRDGVGRESAEDHGVDRADPRAGQQCNRQFRRHAHVDGDPVALPDAQRLERICESLHFDVQLGVGHATNLARLPLPDDCGLAGAGSQSMPVDAVVAQVELAADKPFCRWQVPFEHLVPRLEPMQIFRDSSPEGLGIFDGFLVHHLVLFEAFDVCLVAELLRWREDAQFSKSGVQILIGKR